MEHQGRPQHHKQAWELEHKKGLELGQVLGHMLVLEEVVEELVYSWSPEGWPKKGWQRQRREQSEGKINKNDFIFSLTLHINM